MFNFSEPPTVDSEKIDVAKLDDDQVPEENTNGGY